MLTHCDVSVGDIYFSFDLPDHFIQLTVWICLIFLTFEGFCKLQVEYRIFLALKQVLIDLRTCNLKHLYAINQVKHLKLFLVFGFLLLSLTVVVDYIHGTVHPRSLLGSVIEGRNFRPCVGG